MKQKQMFLWNSLHDPMNVGNLISSSSASLKLCTSRSSQCMYYWSLAWRILSITSLVCRWVQMYSSWNKLGHCPFLGLKWKLTYSSPVAIPEFPNLLTYWVQHFNSIIFWILNSSAGIPSPPLALFVGMLLKVHLTSHSRMSGLGEWPQHPSYLSH